MMVLPFILSNANALAQSKSNLGNQQLTEVKTDSSSKRPRRNFKTPIFSGQKVKDRGVVPVGNQEKITDIVVYFVDEAGKLIYRLILLFFSLFIPFFLNNQHFCTGTASTVFGWILKSGKF